MDYIREDLVRGVRRRIEREYLCCEIGEKFYLQFIVNELLFRGYRFVKDVPRREFAQLCFENVDPGELTVAEMRDIQRDLSEEADEVAA